MSLDNRNTSAQYKRAEQLKRWEESEMNKKLSGAPKSPSSRRIKFSSGCIFLAACVAGDKEEVEWLLKNGADIDTANVDGLTALHQACIDDNLDMVEFLVQKGADVNRKDNEGWTPLHATASCGFLSIARYLIENGADLASINSDGELAVDLANSDAMEDLIQHHLDEQGIDCEEARQAEERIMLSDATKWLRTDSPDCDKAHPKTGATAIHVAAAKGYIGVLKLLLEGRGDIDRQDVDGWTPLHAAAYWGQKEATQMLLNASADIDVQNYSGQLAIDIAQDDIVPLLKDARKNGKRTKRRPPSHGNRITDNFENSTETPTKVIRVEVKPIDSNKEKEVVSEKENKPTEPDVILRRTQSFESDEKFYQRYAELRARIQANSCPHTILPSTPINTKTSTASNNNNNNSSNNNNNNNSTTTTTTATTPASNISSYLVQRSASLKDHRTLRKTTSNLVLGSTTTSPSSATGPASGATTNLVPPAATGTGAANNTTGSTTGSSGAVSPPTSPSGTPTTTPTAGQIRRSFVPPTRDEESETQRKAHAKRVRETRRSTQGVTLDEIKSAEQLVKKKNATGTGNENDTMAPATATATTTTTTTPSSPSSLSSTASPSFTNDRVPAVGSTGDQQQQGSNHVTEGSVAHDATGGSGGGGSTKVEEIAVSASFTLAAPGSSLDDGGDGGGGGGGGGGHRRHRRSVAGMDDEEEDDSKVTVSYTISAPVRQSSPSPRAVASAAAVSNSKESADPLDGTGAGDVPAVTATFHVPAAASEPMVATSATIRTSSGAAGGVVSNSDSNTTTTTTTNNTSNSNNNNTSASSNTNHNTAATTTTTTYTKRSLFDIDNANSLTLAEKLRHEANKYAIAAVADGDLDSHLVARVPASNSGTTNSGGGGGESNSTSTNAPADNSAASAGAAVPPSPTLRKADPATTTTTGVTAERRPSWRLKVDGGSKFKLEDASTPNAATQSSSVASGGSVYEPSGPANQAPEHGLTTTKLTSSSALAQRRAQQQNGDSSSTATTGTTSSSVASSRPLSAPASGLAAGEQYNRVPGSAASAAGEQQQTGAAATDPNSPLHHLRRPPKSAGEENKENDKENDSRSTAQATQAVIQRRRRQKRRSTGVVSVGMEDLDPDRQDSPVDGDEKETGSERGRSRVGSTASELDTANQPQDSTRENGGDCIDYKALYEQEKADNDKLKMALRKKDEEVVTLKAALDRFTTATTKNNSLSELEKRERRAMERKMSEMEEELKLLQKYKTENERLRAENRALTRVVSKLTTSAQNQIHASKQ
ncbi:protein phosphatase 1 regulatory subunit 12B isoform X11 [Anopheles arabiensis]|uniref:protein phosphatase 1 regulatory subunit 12B isoform X11 n=1 Tax=Anopheles arabiensis TaxID=7173 RepID=UPI001AAD8B75|nr:protein phosphatase 1 regulatory subunit 12B isoform X11 [Anopheles arabiensis]